MTPPRFYAPEAKLAHDFWLQDERFVRLWQKLGYEAGQELVLFDGRSQDRLYRLEELTPREAHLTLVTEFERKIPVADTYILWRLSSKAYDEMLKKYTALGVTHFLPLMAEHSASNFDPEHAAKLIIEASEQSGRSDVPIVRQPMHLQTALQELSGKAKLLVQPEPADIATKVSGPLAYFLTPEDGWTAEEQGMLQQASAQKH